MSSNNSANGVDSAAPSRSLSEVDYEEAKQGLYKVGQAADLLDEARIIFSSIGTETSEDGDVTSYVDEKIELFLQQAPETLKELSTQARQHHMSRVSISTEDFEQYIDNSSEGSEETERVHV